MSILSLVAILRKLFQGIVITTLMITTGACALLNNIPGISAEEDSRIAPFPPSPLTAKKVEAGVELSWNGTKSDYVRAYRIYRRLEGQKSWEFIHEEKLTGVNEGRFTYVDPFLNRSGSIQYAITAVDVNKNESPEKEISDLVKP